MTDKIQLHYYIYILIVAGERKDIVKKTFCKDKDSYFHIINVLVTRLGLSHRTAKIRLDLLSKIKLDVTRQNAPLANLTRNENE